VCTCDLGYELVGKKCYEICRPGYEPKKKKCWEICKHGEEDLKKKCGKDNKLSYIRFKREANCA
jgi:hypothetical protein